MTGDESLIAYHSPCTLQHGLKRAGSVEALLAATGVQAGNRAGCPPVLRFAGSYSILQKDLSQQLLHRKLECLEKEQPAIIATANIGCMMHLQSGTESAHEALDRTIAQLKSLFRST